MTAALIITAGQPAQAGGREPIQNVGTISAIQRIVMVFQRAGIERIAVVCDEAEDQTKKLAAHMNLEFLDSGGKTGPLEQIKVGLSYLLGKCAAVLIAGTDIPLVTVDTIHTLMEARGPFCLPSYHGSAGRPALLRAEHFPAVLAYERSGGLLEAAESAGLLCQMVEVEDEGVLANIQSGKADARLVANHDLADLRLDFRVRLIREKAFYGPGTHQLLTLTEESGSLLEACRHMGISYSKGRKIISTTEQQIGYPVIKSQQGGKTGGGSAVTKEGKALMQSYAAFHAEARQCLEELFRKHFGAF